MFDPLMMIQIDLIACRMAAEADDTRAPIEVIDDAMVGRAITEYFAECEEWSDDLLEPALAEYRRAKELEGWARSAATGILNRFSYGAR